MYVIIYSSAISSTNPYLGCWMNPITAVAGQWEKGFMRAWAKCNSIPGCFCLHLPIFRQPVSWWMAALSAWMDI